MTFLPILVVYQMDQLRRLYDNSPGIGAKQLYIKALKEGLQVNKRVVDDFIARKGEAQIFQRRKVSDGATAPRDESEAMMDLIDFRASKSGRYQYILILVIVFTRQVFLKSVVNKLPATISKALKELLDRVDPPLTVISSDQGGDMMNVPVSKLLEQRNIAHRLKSGINDLSVLDRTVQTLKIRLSKALTSKSKTNWASEVKALETAYNETSHGHLLDAEPGNVPKEVKFELYKQSAQALESNHDKNKKRTESLETTDQFRAPLKQKAFSRSFQPRFSEIKKVASVQAGVVKDTSGQSHLLKNIQIIKPGSTDPKPPDPPSKAIQRKPVLRPFADALKTYITAVGRPIALTTVGRHLNAETDFAEARGNTSILQFVKLFPDMFKVIGTLSQTKVGLK